MRYACTPRPFHDKNECVCMHKHHPVEMRERMAMIMMFIHIKKEVKLS